MMNSSKLNDPFVVCGALFVTCILSHMIQDKWRRSRDFVAEEGGRNPAAAIESSGDAYHRVRYQTAIREQKNLAEHTGHCHCSKVQFKILAPRVLYAVDVPSKIRFPRVTVHYHDFDLLNTDPSVLSMYTVQQMESSNVGIHSFCSFCGMQILYAPSIDPIEVQVNLDCLDAGSIEAAHIAYHSSLETLPLPVNEEFNKRGVGYWSSHSDPIPEITEQRLHTISEDFTEPFYSSTARPNSSSDVSKSEKPIAEKGVVNEEDNLSITSVDSVDMRSAYYRPRSSFSMLSDDDSVTNSSFHSHPGRHRPLSYPSSITDSYPNSPANQHYRKYYQHYPQQYSSGNTLDFNAYQQMKRYMHRHMSNEGSKYQSKQSQSPPSHRNHRKETNENQVEVTSSN